MPTSLFNASNYSAFIISSLSYIRNVKVQVVCLFLSLSLMLTTTQATHGKAAIISNGFCSLINDEMPIGRQQVSQVKSNERKKVSPKKIIKAATNNDSKINGNRSAHLLGDLLLSGKFGLAMKDNSVEKSHQASGKYACLAIHSNPGSKKVFVISKWLWEKHKNRLHLPEVRMQLNLPEGETPFYIQVKRKWYYIFWFSEEGYLQGQCIDVSSYDTLPIKIPSKI